MPRTVRLTATESAEIRQKEPTNNFGSIKSIIIKGYTIRNSVPQNDRYSGVLKFDVSSIPSNATIINASLNNYIDFNGISESEYLNIQTLPINVTWSESTVTWSQVYQKWDAKVDEVVFRDSGTGWRTFAEGEALRNLVQGWVSGTKTNNGIYLFANDWKYQAFVSIASRHYDDSTKRPYLELEINVPPTAPKVITPNGGETLSSIHEIRWLPATDDDGDSLRYKVELSTDNGQNFKTLVELTQPNVNFINYDFTNEPESSMCRIRVTAYDGISYGPPAMSAGVFTIQHNFPPNPPTRLSPTSGMVFDRTKPIRFTWQHNDLNPNNYQSKFDLQWSSTNGATWTTVSQTTTNQYWDAPANTFPEGHIVWRVRTYNQLGLVSGWSHQESFDTGGTAVEPTIVSPTNNSTLASAIVTVQWSSPEQTAYELQILDSSDTLYWGSGEVTSTNKARTVEQSLQNHSTYTIRVRVKNNAGLWSAWSQVKIKTLYDSPAKPLLSLEKKGGHINVVINNPTPAGGQPKTSHNDIYRNDGTGWVRIAKNMPLNTVYADYGVASGVEYEYRIVAHGENSGTVESDAKKESIILKGIWLHCVKNPSETIRQYRLFARGRQTEWKPDMTTLRFQGRTRPVVEYGDMEDYGVRVTLELIGDNDYLHLKRLIQSKTTVCYRDARGRKVFGVIPFLSETEEFYGWTIPIEVIETAYTEEV